MWRDGSFSILILVSMVIYGPSAKDELSLIWKAVQPTVLGFRDSIWAVIPNFIAGREPGVDFDHVVTMDCVPAKNDQKVIIRGSLI